MAWTAKLIVHRLSGFPADSRWRIDIYDGNTHVATANGATKEEAEERARLIIAAQDTRKTLEALTKSLRALIANSEGVAGLHLNGDVAPWDELLAGGYFENWLKALNEAENVLRGEEVSHEDSDGPGSR